MSGLADLKVMRDYIRMCRDGVAMGWHERNGGNLTYRMKPWEAAQCLPYCKAEPGPWVGLGVQAGNLKGEYLIATGRGKHLRNVEREPQNNLCIVEINKKGDACRVVWGLENGGSPTSELAAHVRNHAVRKRVSGGQNRVIYHAHPPYIVALTYVLPLKTEVFTRMLWKSETECCMVFPGGVGVVPCMTPGSPQLAEATCGLMETYDAAVWAFHGLIVSGADFDGAFGLMHTIEKAAQIASVALAARGGKGPAQTITDEDLRAIASSLGVTLNEEILNYRQTGVPYC